MTPERRPLPSASEPEGDDALEEAPLPAPPELAPEPRAGLPVVAPDALAALDGRTDPVRALLWAVIRYVVSPARHVTVGGGYRSAAVPLAAAASGEEGTRFEAAGLRWIGSVRERAGWVSTASDVHLSEDGAVHVFARQTRMSGSVASTLSSYYLFSVLSDGTVVETVQAPKPYLESTTRYVCRAGEGSVELDVSAHRRAIARLCRERGVYVVAVRDLDDVVRQQRFSYRHALPLGSAMLSLGFVLAPVFVVVAAVVLLLAFLR